MARPYAYSTMATTVHGGLRTLALADAGGFLSRGSSRAEAGSGPGLIEPSYSRRRATCISEGWHQADELEERTYDWMPWDYAVARNSVAVHESQRSVFVT